jgi:hypothetical protein
MPLVFCCCVATIAHERITKRQRTINDSCRLLPVLPFRLHACMIDSHCHFSFGKDRGGSWIACPQVQPRDFGAEESWSI